MEEELTELTSEMDLELMMEFRQTYPRMWTHFCKSRGYKSEIAE